MKHTSHSLGLVTPRYGLVERAHRRGDSHRTVQHAPEWQFGTASLANPNMVRPTLTPDQRQRAVYGW